MKTILIGVVFVILMAASGGVGYYFGNDNGLKTATTIRTEFFANRAGSTGADPNAQGATRGNNQAGGQNFPGAGQVVGMGGRPTAAGTVKGIQGNTITVTQQDGSTTTVTVDDKTEYTKLGTATLADVTPGLRIVVTDQNGIKRIQLTPGQ
ncbi:MAG: hypothetical protein HZB51_31800 [Chloroflexi bacterium]|nr:hypothetical protein [Chloroflexota bacterium]